jgi:hypothetical protein
MPRRYDTEHAFWGRREETAVLCGKQEQERTEETGYDKKAADYLGWLLGGPKQAFSGGHPGVKT